MSEVEKLSLLQRGNSWRETLPAVAVRSCSRAVQGDCQGFVQGARMSFTRAWAQELVVYLAMHPKGVTNEAWATALWPDRLMAPSSLHSTASVARRALGQSRDGQDHLPRSHGRLCLAPTVGTDWDRFVALCEGDSPKSWRAALELVRGRPFEGLRASDWPVLEGIAPAIEATVVDVSGRLAGASLRSGDPGGCRVGGPQGSPGEPLRRASLPHAHEGSGRGGKSGRSRGSDGRARSTRRRWHRTAGLCAPKHARALPLAQPAPAQWRSRAIKS